MMTLEELRRLVPDLDAARRNVGPIPVAEWLADNGHGLLASRVAAIQDVYCDAGIIAIANTK